MAQLKNTQSMADAGAQLSASTMPSQIIHNLMNEPLFYQWCQGAFWVFPVDQTDFENKVKNLLGVKDFSSLDSDTKAVKTFEIFLDRPYRAWLEKRTAGANSVYQYPVPYLDEHQLKKDIINAAINEQFAEVVMR
ncbi:hypothetical protein [Methylotenera sp.]|uniref:hypothetical protein n=1 Tax=Methylotenera sp. TaxID=2051956 RepID=UPI00271C0CA7|nr:hypothetical protein [Methylotenera sp.]MDO9205613.1 hypothetical protein [Methylotenera sp.]MDP2071824.1 hypothetical protein [Methylotenera sp.]